MTIKNNKLYFTPSEHETLNLFAVMMSAAGLTCVPWQNFGFAEDLCNCAITLSTITANADYIGKEYVFDLSKEIYGSEYDEQGFCVDNCISL